MNLKTFEENTQNAAWTDKWIKHTQLIRVTKNRMSRSDIHVIAVY